MPVGADERITQVATNLVTSAVKYTPPGRAGDGALLTVAGTGPGIPAADLPRVFERVWRGSSAKGGTAPAAWLSSPGWLPRTAAS